MGTVATTATNLSGSGAIAPDGGFRIVGIFVSTSASLTLKLWDNPAAAGTVLLATTAAITAPAYYPVRVSGANGGFCTFGGTGTITIYWERA